MNTFVLADVQLVRADAPDELEAARRLFCAYADWLAVDLCFQGFEQELKNLPGAYAPPEGRLLVARAGDDVVGCVALRPQGPGICEMKRLWVERASPAPASAGRSPSESSRRDAGSAIARCVSIPCPNACPRPSTSTRASAFAKYRRITTTRSRAWSCSSWI